jgi:hypothetical protein
LAREPRAEAITEDACATARECCMNSALLAFIAASSRLQSRAGRARIDGVQRTMDVERS